MITGIEHIGLCATDPGRLAEWYSSVLGFTLIREIEDRKTYFLRSRNGGILEIYPASRSTQRADNHLSGLRHLALSVSDFEEELRSLHTAGVDVLEDSIVRADAMKLVFFRDPEGNLLHLVERAVAL